MKKALTVFLVTVVFTTALAVPAAAASTINSSSGYSVYSDYEAYVDGLLDEGLITQKGANAMLNDYNATTVNNFEYGYGRGGGWRYGGYSGRGHGGYGGMGYGHCH